MLGVAGKTYSDYQRVSSGGMPLGGFCELADNVTRQRFDRHTKSNAEELINIQEELKSRALSKMSAADLLALTPEGVVTIMSDEGLKLYAGIRNDITHRNRD